MLQRILGSHSEIQTHPEPHVLTPLAFQGYYYQIEKAAFNHRAAAKAFREFVDFLPSSENDYLDACRSYCSVLYSRAIEGSGKRYFLDKTPNYANTILPFIEKVLPEAKFIVLTRHPLAILSSGANTFYGGDYDRFYYNRDVLGSFIPPISRFMRETSVSHIHIRYEDIVTKPECEVKRLLEFLDLDYEQECIHFGKKKHITKTYGDPSIGTYEKPETISLQKWVLDLVNRRDRRRLCEHILRSIPDDDMSMYGYPIETVWAPLNDVNMSGQSVEVENASLRDRLTSMKWSIVRIAQFIASFPAVTRIVRKLVRLCDALLKHR